MTGPVILRCARDLTARLTPARHALGLTQHAMARRMGIHQTKLNSWELGQVQPDFVSAVQIAEALGCDLALVPREERT
jgi:transcriptional regulator with XRE-family HTH domain